MCNIVFQVKQSKKIILLCIICGIIFELIGGLGIFLAVKGLIKNDSASFDDFVGNIYGLCFSLCLSILFIILSIYLIYNYNVQIDTYTNDKMCRKKGKRIIFEIPYKNIITVKHGFESVFFVLKEPIIKVNGKKGPRNFYAHYAQRDIDRIIQIINSAYLNMKHSLTKH